MLSGCVVPFLDFFLNRAIEKIVVLLMVQTSGEKTKTHRLDVFETLERLGTTTNLNRCRISEPSTGAWNPPRPFFFVVARCLILHLLVTTATVPTKKSEVHPSLLCRKEYNSLAETAPKTSGFFSDGNVSSNKKALKNKWLTYRKVPKKTS